MRISDWSSDVCSSDLVSDLELDMRFSIRSIDREFSPAEAAEITGVSTALQRDWRRRGILPENADGKWTRWDLNDIIKLSVMKLFSDAGIDVSKTSIVSQKIGRAHV